MCICVQDALLENPSSLLGSAANKKAAKAPSRESHSPASSNATTTLKRKTTNAQSAVKCTTSSNQEEVSLEKRKRVTWNKSDDALLEKVFKYALSEKIMPTIAAINSLKQKNHGLKDRHHNVIKLHLKALMLKKTRKNTHYEIIKWK